jgi:hypothetical protein
MAVYGIGAMYGGVDDQTEKFITMGVACVGWGPSDAPAVHAQMAAIKAGDVLFIKSFAPRVGLHIKAVGIVTNGTFREITEDLGWGVSVRWLRMPQEQIVVGPLQDHSDHMRRGTIYEEFNPTVIKRVLDRLVPGSSKVQ